MEHLKLINLVFSTVIRIFVSICGVARWQRWNDRTERLRDELGLSTDETGRYYPSKHNKIGGT